MITEAEKIAAKLINCESVQDARDRFDDVFCEKVSGMLCGLYVREKRKQEAAAESTFRLTRRA